MATPIPDNAATFTLEELAAAVQGRVPSGPTGYVEGVTTDSRRAGPGRLFVALRGDRHDAHRFLPAVAESGARAALVERGAVVPPPLIAVEVEDTRTALGLLARHHRRRWAAEAAGQVIAITGSAGKTTTKELTAAALTAAGRRVVKTAGNLNNLIGVPMTLLTLDAASDTAVVEIGTSGPGEIAALTAMSEPDLGVVTTVAAAHTEGLGSVERVADEKLDLMRGLGPAGVGVYGIDAPLLAERGKALLGARGRSFGRAPDAYACLLSHTLDAELRSHCRYRIGPDELEVALSLVGTAPAVDAAAALAVVVEACGSGALGAACRGLSSVAQVPGRLFRCVGPAGSLLIDDSYNANPASVRASLETLCQVGRARGGRTIAVLGDMGELGELAEAEHRRVGDAAVAEGVDVLITCGPLMALAADAASQLRVHCVSDATSAEAHLRDLGSKDTVLIKGSRSMRMERLVTALMAPEGVTS